MKKKVFGGTLILILLLVGTVGAVSINYAEKQGVTVDNARDSAEATLYNFILSGSPGSTIGSWRGATLASEPIVIYDISGLKYAYQFDVLLKGKTVGEITAAANKLAGQPIIGIDTIKKSYTPNAVNTRSVYPKGSVKYILVVLYQKSKTGTLVILQDDLTGAFHRLLYNENAQMISDVQSKGAGMIDYDITDSLFSAIGGSEAELKVSSYESIRKTLVKNLPALRIQLRNPYLTNPEVVTPVIRPATATTTTTNIFARVKTQGNKLAIPSSSQASVQLTSLYGGTSGMRNTAGLISGLTS